MNVRTAALFASRCQTDEPVGMSNVQNPLFTI